MSKMAESPPNPQDDWISQQRLARMLSVSQRTASTWAKQGKLRQYEHGVPTCGHRKYSRSLVDRQLQKKWAQAILRQDAAVGEIEGDHRQSNAVTPN